MISFCRNEIAPDAGKDGMDGSLILAVDGGGSASRVALYREDATPYAEAVVGPLSRKSSGREAVARSLAELRGFLENDASRIRCAVLALSGLDADEDYDAMAALLADAGLAARGAALRRHAYGRKVVSRWEFPILLCSDAVAPLFANGFGEGVVVVAGTGSVALRIGANGAVELFGGWGYRCSDEGSGCWVGCELARGALRVADEVLSGRTDASRLPAASRTLLDDAFAAMRAQCASRVAARAPLARKARFVCDWASAHDDPKDYASLAKAVLESRGSRCREIRQLAAERLACLARDACADGLRTVVLAGGLFASRGFAEQVSRAIAARVEGPLTIVANMLPPTVGAYALAQHVWPAKPSVPQASNANVRKSMQGNKGADTKPEMVVRRMLREAGLAGYRLHWKAPGRPDVAWPSQKVCVMVNGCFWHRHAGCRKATMPKSNIEYWIAKFDRNVERDAENLQKLQDEGWRVHIVWECELEANRRDETMANLVAELREELGK